MTQYLAPEFFQKRLFQWFDQHGRKQSYCQMLCTPTNLSLGGHSLIR